jgi:hypothetical protein
MRDGKADWPKRRKSEEAKRRKRSASGTQGPASQKVWTGVYELHDNRTVIVSRFDRNAFTYWTQRTGRAARCVGNADCCSDIHYCLIEHVGFAFGCHTMCNVPQKPRRLSLRRERKEPCQHSFSVGIQDCGILSKCEAGDCACGIRTNTRQPF